MFQDSVISDIMVKQQICQTLIKVKLVWLGDWKRRYRKRHIWWTVHVQSLRVRSESGVWVIKRQVSGQWCIAHGALIPEESGNSYALFVVTEQLQQPKSSIITTVTTQIFFSEHTVPRALLCMGLRIRWPKHVPALRVRHRHWVHEHRNRNMEGWKEVAWFESHLLVHHIDGRVRTHRFPEETLAPKYTVGRKQDFGR